MGLCQLLGVAFGSLFFIYEFVYTVGGVIRGVGEVFNGSGDGPYHKANAR